MTSVRTFSLLAAATVLSGWLACAALERSAVLMRVWLTLGRSRGDASARARLPRPVSPWTPLSASLIIAAAVSATLDRDSDRTTPAPLVVAAVFSALGLLFAAKAMNLVQLLAASPPIEDLPPIFEAYPIWGVDFRVAAAAVAFVAVVWALLALNVARAPETPGAAQTLAE